jgi:hypothetical protein
VIGARGSSPSGVSGGRPVWRKARAARHAELDAAAGLRRLAHAISLNATRTLRGTLDVRYSEPQSGSYVGAAGCPDRAWRCVAADRELWCVIAAPGQSSLFALATGWPSCAPPSPIERSILSDCVERLLERAPGDARSASAREEEHARPASAGAWRCTLEISDGPHTADLQLFTVARPAPPAPTLGESARHAHIPLALSGHFVLSSLALAEIAGWKTGSLVKIDERAGRLEAALRVGALTVARAELGNDARRRCLRLIELRPR